MHAPPRNSVPKSSVYLTWEWKHEREAQTCDFNALIQPKNSIFTAHSISFCSSSSNSWNSSPPQMFLPKFRSINYLSAMLVSSLLLLFLLSALLEFPTSLTFSSSAASPLLTAVDTVGSRSKDPFRDLPPAFDRWDAAIGCDLFRAKFRNWTADASSIQDAAAGDCTALGMKHATVLVKEWTWIPDAMENLYLCGCGMTCLWTKSKVLADAPDAVLFEGATPPATRETGDPLRVYIDLESSRQRTGSEDIFISYHAKDDVQSTYAGTMFHKNRKYSISPQKRNDVLVYWSSSRCLAQRNQLAKKFLSLVSHHSFGKCLNNVGGLNVALSLYPECAMTEKRAPIWWDHLHCSMSHYKFVLAIENTKTESYVTEKLYYALDAGSVPIYFGAPNVFDFIPPNSIIDGSKFGSLEELASYVKALADDPIAYAEYHAWRRCGVMGNYGRARATSLDTVPCRLCELISRKDGRTQRMS